MKPDGDVFDASWRSMCRIVPVRRKDVAGMIGQHYLHKWPGVCTLILALQQDGAQLGLVRCKPSLIGVLVFALPPRETSKRYGGLTWELARVWLQDSVPKNAETYFIARGVRYIRQHHKDVKVLVSYADPSAGHAGTIYKAANWVADGRTDQERKTPRFDYADAVSGKRYSRRGHVPDGVQIQRIPRVSKHRFIYRLAK